MIIYTIDSIVTVSINCLVCSVRKHVKMTIIVFKLLVLSVTKKSSKSPECGFSHLKNMKEIVEQLKG